MTSCRWGWHPLLAALALVAVAMQSARAEPLTDPTARASYSLGHQIGADLLRQGRSVDPGALRKGLLDGLAGRTPGLTTEQMEALLADLKRGIVADERRDRLSGQWSLRQSGADFLAANAKKEGVVSLPSGLQYRVIRSGEGRHPTAEDRVEIRYRSTRLDGVAFHDSMREGSPPDTHLVSDLIPGLVEVLPLMSEGSRWEVFIPSNLAFSRRGPLADHTVIYDLELIGVVPHASGPGIDAKAEGAK